MERSRQHFAAQEVYGRRVIVRSRCQHRLPCADARWHAGTRVHIEGLTFADASAARAFDLARLALPLRQNWPTFPTWELARSWLRDQP